MYKMINMNRMVIQINGIEGSDHDLVIKRETCFYRVRNLFRNEAFKLKKKRTW